MNHYMGAKNHHMELQGLLWLKGVEEQTIGNDTWHDRGPQRDTCIITST